MSKGKIIKKVLVGILVICLTLISCITPIGVTRVNAAVQATYYVAANGSDSNPGTLAQPFATIQKARDVVRIINSNMTGDIYVYIRGGKYYQNSTISFNEADNGTNGYKIYYKNYPGETPEIIGGQKITNWTLDSGNIYKAYVGTSWKFYSLFENGERATMARTPNDGYLTVDSDIKTKIEAEDYSSMSGIVNYGTFIGCDNNGDWVCYNNVNLGTGMAEFQANVAVDPAYAGQYIDVRLDSTTGTLVGTLIISNTGGWGSFQVQTCSLTGASGTHNIYLVARGSYAICNLDWFKFDNPPPKVQAENYSSMSGVVTQGGGTGTVIGSCDNNDWVCYNNIDFGSSGGKTFAASVAVDPSSSGQRIDIRLDSTTGPLAGYMYVTSTGGWGTYSNQQSGLFLADITGTHNLYLVFRGTYGVCNIDWFRIVDSPTVKGFVYGAGDLPSFDYSDAQVVIWPGGAGWNWFTATMAITGVDTSTRAISCKPAALWGIDTGARYFVQGSGSFLDQVGEFYLDESTGYLYYWPEKTPIAAQEIVAPRTKRIIELKGSSSTNLVSNIQFEGLTLTMSDFAKTYTMPYYELFDQNECDSGREGLVYLENAEYNTVKFCKILNAGFCGIILNKYAQNNTVYGNLIKNIGYTGVYLTGWGMGEGNFASASAAYVNKYNVISNNFINDCGKYTGHGSGIQLYQSGDNEISYNEISKMSRYGISLKGSPFAKMKYCTYYGTAVTEQNFRDFVFSRNNNIKFNDVYDCLRDSQDAGLIESWCPGNNNIIDNNRVHDSTSGIPDSCAIGIYLDDGSDNFTVKNNVIYNIQRPSSEGKVSAAVLKGQNNVFTNNVVADCETDHSISCWEMGGLLNDNITITKNIFYNSSNPNIYFFGVWKDNSIAASDYNTFYSSSGNYGFYGIPGDDTWANWRTLYNNKFDQNSILADPLFTDSSNRNYTVLPGSPALVRGFANIDQQNIGLKSDFPYNVGQDVSSIMEAENFTLKKGLQVASGGTGTVLGTTFNGDWLCYTNLDFGPDFNKFQASIAVDPVYAGQQIEVRLDSPTGTLLGTLTTTSTGSWSTFQTQSCNISGATGRHNLFLVFTGSMGCGVCNLDWFRFGSTFVNTMSPGALRNDFSGYAGMKITVGASPITIKALGRIYVNGNSNSHTVKIVNASDGTDVPNGSVTIPMAGGTAGQFKYVYLTNPVTLSANTSYYIVSLETNGGDQWYDVNNTTVTTTSVATCDSGVVNNGAWNTYSTTNHTYVPVDFRYTY